MEPLLEWANNQALLNLLGLIGNIGIIIAVLTYVISEEQRRDIEILNAWQTITSAHDQGGDGGRIRALEFLNASPGANWRRKFPWFCAPHKLCLWTAESLAGIDLGTEPVAVARSRYQRPSLNQIFLGKSLARVYLENIHLQRANLRNANLQGVILSGANLEGSMLSNSNLEGALLYSANLNGAILKEAHLRGAILNGASLKEVNLERANLEVARLQQVDLRDADLSDANLMGADLSNANLKNTNLIRANLAGANLHGTNPNVIHLYFADLCLTELPKNIAAALDHNEDCEKLGIDPEKGIYDNVLQDDS
ncbi:MAG: pentapeptide repeat-containing protein [Leptolyngbyaceae cyanobacterium SL_5_14]|nr:pentapeptide repeat-containing protein [Leptolyngbyaceae cyanobacterium SL_5_14]